MTDPGFSRIIVILDGGQMAERAIPIASALAAQASLPVTLVRVIPDGDPGDEARGYLRARQSEVSGVADLEVLSGVPAANTLLRFLRDHPRALLCCTTRARSGLGELLLGSVAEELIRRSPVPLVLVGPHAALPGAGGQYRELVMCVEEDAIDPATSRLLPVAHHLCVRADLRPWLFQVMEPAELPAAGHGGTAKEGQALPRLTEALAEGGLEAQQLVSRAGDVPQAISFFAGTLTGPIVALSSRTWSLGERIREGSVAVGVARTAPCPVLVVGPSCRSHEELADQVRNTAP